MVDVGCRCLSSQRFAWQDGETADAVKAVRQEGQREVLVVAMHECGASACH